MAMTNPPNKALCPALASVERAALAPKIQVLTRASALATGLALALGTCVAFATPINWETTAQFVFGGPTVVGETTPGVGVAGGGVLEAFELSTMTPINNSDTLLEDLDNGFRVTNALFRYTASVGDQTAAEAGGGTVSLALKWEARRGFTHPPGAATTRSELDGTFTVTAGTASPRSAILQTWHLSEGTFDSRALLVNIPGPQLLTLSAGQSAGYSGSALKGFDHESADLDVLVQQFELQFLVSKVGDTIEFRFPTSVESLTFISHLPDSQVAAPETLSLLSIALVAVAYVRRRGFRRRL